MRDALYCRNEVCQVYLSQPLAWPNVQIITGFPKSASPLSDDGIQRGFFIWAAMLSFHLNLQHLQGGEHFGFTNRRKFHKEWENESAAC